jgi:hypothetical protein
MKTIFVLMLSFAILFTGCAPATAVLPAQTAAPAATATTAPTQVIAATAPPAPQASSIRYPEADPIIELSYDPALTGAVEGGLVPAVANTSDQPFYLIHPAFVQILFPEIGKAITFQLPYPIEGPRMMVYRTQDFAGYENPGQTSYPDQFNRLKEMIENGIAPDTCAQPLSGGEKALPFLPLLNSAQVFCAKPQMVSFDGGKGIRYVTYYSQGFEPAVEWYAFYTFQGLTQDGQYYISALLPVKTNILPNEAPQAGSQVEPETLKIQLREQVSQINAQADDQFTPSLTVLDELVGGMTIPAK